MIHWFYFTPNEFWRPKSQNSPPGVNCKLSNVAQFCLYACYMFSNNHHNLEFSFVSRCPTAAQQSENQIERLD